MGTFESAWNWKSLIKGHIRGYACTLSNNPKTDWNLLLNTDLLLCSNAIKVQVLFSSDYWQNAIDRNTNHLIY